MNNNTMALIILTAIIYVIVSRQEIILAIKNQVQHILTLAQESFTWFTLIGKCLFCNMLLFPFQNIYEHNTIIKVFAIF